MNRPEYLPKLHALTVEFTTIPILRILEAYGRSVGDYVNDPWFKIPFDLEPSVREFTQTLLKNFAPNLNTLYGEIMVNFDTGQGEIVDRTHWPPTSTPIAESHAATLKGRLGR
jgi:hypothetical protein